MKLFYLITSLENGGAQLTIPPVVSSLRQQGCDVTVLACEPRDMKAAAKLEAAGIPYTILCSGKRNKLAYTLALIRYLRHNRPDVLWTSLSVATLVGQLAGKYLNIPVVSWKNNAEARRYTQFFRNFTKLWIADSAMVAQFLLKDMHLPASRVMTWPLYCCDTTAHITDYWDGIRPLRLGSMGRLKEQKNYALLIRAIHKLLQARPELTNRLHLSIAGDGPLKEELQNQINQAGLQNTITLLGYNTNPQGFLQGLDVYVQPSLFEGMCLAGHEAMAMGLPIIATPVGELAFSVISGQTGFSLAGNLESSLCDALNTLFAHPQLVQRYGRNAREFVQTKFSQQAFDAAGARIVEHVKTALL